MVLAGGLALGGTFWPVPRAGAPAAGPGSPPATRRAAAGGLGAALAQRPWRPSMPATPTATTAPAVPRLPDLEVVATVGAQGADPRAYLRRKDTKGLQLVRPGSVVGGFTIRAITEGQVVVETGGVPQILRVGRKP